MRYAILADIHANATAFEAVLADMERRGGADEIWCLGDIVGYGPDPGRCIDLLRGYKHAAVAGNHDLGAIEKISLARFNPDGAQALRWTMGQLKPEHRIFLERLPDSREIGAFTLVHGSPRQPFAEYIASLGSARQVFACFKTNYCLVGHTHLPLIFSQEGGECAFNPPLENIGRVLEAARLIINPGSVGQPRDGNPRASYMLFDSDAGILRLHRVAYDINAVQARYLAAAGLPLRLSARLERGA